MKLSERTSLSGRPEFLKPPMVQALTPKAERRQCAMCGLKDIAHLLDGEPVHSVTVELKFVEAPNEQVARQRITSYLATRGWRYRMHLGRHAMERDICRECLVRSKEMAEEFGRKKSNESKASMHSDSYYLAVCGD